MTTKGAPAAAAAVQPAAAAPVAPAPSLYNDSPLPPSIQRKIKKVPENRGRERGKGVFLSPFDRAFHSSSFLSPLLLLPLFFWLFESQGFKKGKPES
jgi:hypothetical protein